MLAITINTNKAGNTAAEVEYMTRKLEGFFRHTLADYNNWRELLRVEPNFDAVKKISVDAIGIEIGKKRHFVHAHFVVTVEHTGKILYRYTQRKWQNLLNRTIPVLKGAYTQVQLLNARGLNYAAKYTGTRREIATIGTLPALVF